MRPSPQPADVSPTGKGFVCALNRDRDGYQIPLALQEAGLLDMVVADFYAPDHASGWLPGPLRRRRTAGIPRAKVTTAPASFAVQSGAQLLRLPMPSIYPLTDGMLGRKAGRVAARRGAHLYCYAPYLPPASMLRPGTRRAIFDFHPLPGLLFDVLTRDLRRFPEAAWSYASETKLLANTELQNVWKRADAVACASSLTKRSLVYAGCDPDRITVIPYGFELPDAGEPEDVPAPRGVRTEFLFVGQGIQRKGLHHLIRAWQAAPIPNARLTLVCYLIDPGIKALIRDPSIELLGHQSDTELDALYRRADVFVMPSLIEGFGLVYLEALARGCVVVGTANTGLPDLHLPADVARSLPVGDLDALRATLEELAIAHRADRLDRAAVRAAARQRSWADFREGIAAHARSVLG